MKRKYLAMLMGVMLAAASVPATALAEEGVLEIAEESAEESSGESLEENSQENAAGQETYGEVTAVSENTITVKIGTRKESNGREPGAFSEDQEEASSDSGFEQLDNDTPQMPGGEMPSMLDLTGEEQTLTVSDATVITRQNLDRGGMDGQQPEGGEPLEKPDDEPGGQSQSEALEAPENEPGGESQMEAPEKPDDAGQPPAMEAEAITLADIQEGDVISFTLAEDGSAATITVQTMGRMNGMDGAGDMGEPGDMGGPGDMGEPGDMGDPGGMGGPGGQTQAVESYDAANEYSEDTDVSETELESTGTDENAALVSAGANVTFDNVTITRNSEESTGGDTASFYGVGAALLATDGNAYVKGGSVTTDADGGAGLFAYGNGTVYAVDTTITTQKDTSGGIHAAGGGTLYAWDLNVETNGESAAAVRSDRGGGTMVVDGGSYTSNGAGSPAVYSTADIAINNATLTATGSEAVCIEGLNSLRLYECDLAGNMSDLDQNDNTWTVILYQSMSGDSEVGNSTFQMSGGTLTSQNGGVFYTTNTESTITLENVDVTYNDDNEFFLQCTGNTNQRGWGTAGNNGADCHFTAISQEMQGDVIWDSISNLDMYLTDGSSLTGAVRDDETYAGSGGNGYCNLYVSEDSTWTVTGDSQVTSLYNPGTIVDEEGKTVTIQGTDGTAYAEGESDYTVTVETYSDSADLTGASTIDDWSSYQVERPENL